MTPIETSNQRPSPDSPARGTGEPHRADMIYEQLGAHLQNGRYGPGEKLTLRELAAEFGASLTPVRDALNRMVAERVLEMTANRTVIVPIPLAAEVREVRRIRMELEGFATAEAALHITDQEMAEVERHHQAYLQARQDGDVADMQEANRNLHFTIYAAARMPFLLEMIKTFWLRNGPLQHLLHQAGTSSSQPSNTHHQTIVEALRQRDGAAARQGICEDIDYPTDAIIVALSERRDSLAGR
jgi:DNA-binding GntR family transcriptional regulator